MIHDKKAILLFELGHLQVFHYQSFDEWNKGLAPAPIFWAKRGENIVHGPFDTIHHAVSNYTAYIATSAIPAKDNVVHVDFKAKKRI